MANDRVTRYRVEIDTASARREAAEFARVFQTEVNRAMMQQTASAGGSAPGMGGMGGAIGGGLLGKMMGVAGGYLTVQGLKNLALGAADLSVQVNRSTSAFVALSGSAAEAEKRLKAIQQASGNTMDDLQAMNLANNLVSLGMAKSAEEMERAVTIGRKIGVVMGTDVRYALENLSRAAANLSFVRLDQMGISATQVRARMKELQAASKDLGEEQAFLTATLQVAEQNFKGIDVAAAENVSGLEKLGTAWSNLTQTVAASGVGQAINRELVHLADMTNQLLGKDDGGVSTRQGLNEILASRREQLKEHQAGNLPAKMKDFYVQADQSAVEDMEKAADAFDRLRAVMNSGVPGLEKYNAALGGLMGQMINLEGQITPKQVIALNNILKVVGALESGTSAYSKAVEAVGQEFLEADPNAAILAAALTNLEAMYATGAIYASEYTTQVNALTGALVVLKSNADAVAAMGPLTQEAAAAAAAAGGASGLWKPQQPMTMEDWTAGVSGWANMPLEERGKRQREQREQAAQAEAERLQREGDTRREFNDWNRAYQEKQQSEAERAAREWEAAAKKTQSEFEAAANAMVDEFKSALEQVPGLFGASSVTEEDMAAAAGGYYEEKADEWLRQLSDEVINKVDHPNTDIADAKRRAGLPENMPDEVALQRITSMWNDQSLFAGNKNLDLINQDAARASFARQEASKSGRQAIYGLFGLPPDDAATAAMSGALPTGTGAAEAGAAAGAAPADAAATDPLILQKLQEQMTNGAAVEALRGTGDAVAGFIYDGFRSGVGARDWRSPLVDAITNQVTAQALANINAALNN